MQEFLKTRAKPIVVLALVGLASVVILLSLATQKGETQGGKKPADEKRLARLKVNSTEEWSYEHVFGGRHERKVERKTLEATIVFEFPEGMEQLQETTCEELEKTIRQARKDCTQLPGELCAKSIREMEEGARKCRETIPTYGFTWDAVHKGVGSVPGPIALVSFTGQASYFREEKSEEHRFGHCMPGIRPTKVESTYFSTEKGNGTLRPGPDPIEGAFNVNVMGDRVFGLTVYGNSFDVTGHWKTTSTTICDSSSETGPTLSSRMKIYVHFPVSGTGADPDWQVQVSRTANGYTGNASYKKQDEGGWVITKTFSFTFDIGEAVYEVVVTPPKKLQEWIPKGGENENTAGDTLKFTGQVQEKKGSKSKGSGSRKVKVVFELTSSREPGIAMNFPPKAEVSDPPRPDLRILKDGTSSAFKITEETREDGLGQYKAEGEFKVGESFTLVVGAFDYGAYGYLNVSAEAPVRIEHYPDTNRVWLPKDDNMNSIADKWEERDKGVRGRASDSDEDSKPEGDGTPGDGLSLYEEYRGFMVQGHHIRTNPKYKDLFVFDLNKMGPGHFKKSGLRLHFIKLSEFYEDPASETPNTAVINFNHGHANLGKQHLLFFMDGDGIGRTGYSDGGGPPKEIKYVLVDKNAHRDYPNPKEELATTIAHELAHASNVGHHGNCDYEVEKVELQDPNEKWITVSFGHITIGVTGGQNSGPTCIMKYNDASYYEKPNGRFRWEKEAGKGFAYGERYPRGEPTGNIFCNTKRGTVVTGNATYGECKKQFCINDTKPCLKTPDFQCR